MNEFDKPFKLLFIGTYPPTRCGIATFIHHLRHGAQKSHHLSDEQLPVIAILPESDNQAPHQAPPGVKSIAKHDPTDYIQLAAWINESDIDAISLQHEFGIFGGEAGQHILLLLQDVKKPVITTFHTVFEHPVEPYASVQREIVRHSDRIIVMNRLAIPYLTDHFDVKREHIHFLPHGAPRPPERSRETLREDWGVQDRTVLLTFGLLSPGKGIEMLLDVLPDVISEVPNLLYMIAGQTHPAIKQQMGERYREKLVDRIRQKRLEEHVRFVNRYLCEDELRELLVACDLYVTPYPGMQQITSGTLAYAIGLGRPTLSTPYAHARDLFRDHPELLIPYEQPGQWRTRLRQLLVDRQQLARVEQVIRQLGSQMSWDIVGRAFVDICLDMIAQAEVVR